MTDPQNDEWVSLPEVQLPEDQLGHTKRYRECSVDVVCKGVRKRLGKVLFGNDGSFYYFLSGKRQATDVGSVRIENGAVASKANHHPDLLPDGVTDYHISLHPSGQAHAKTSSDEVIAETNIGSWLPAKEDFVFAYIFTEPVAQLPEVPGQPGGFEIDRDDRSIRLTLTICPPGRTEQGVAIPCRENTVMLGVSHRYALRIDAVAVPPCKACIFFGPVSHESDSEAHGTSYLQDN